MRAVWGQHSNILLPVLGPVPFHHISCLFHYYFKTAEYFQTVLPECERGIHVQNPDFRDWKRSRQRLSSFTGLPAVMASHFHLSL